MADPIRAEIADVEDPEGRGRVLVRSTAIGQNWEGWAEVVRPDPAAPPPAYAPGDAVMILFESGDPGLPVVLGSVSARGEAGPATLVTELPRTEDAWDDLVLPPSASGQLDLVVRAAGSEPAPFGETRLGRNQRGGVLFSGPPGT